jgi:glutamate-1-semialdehyde 2,1-aminomutase
MIVLFLKDWEEKTAYLAAGIDKVLKANNVTFTINTIGSISVHFDATSVVDFKTAANGDNENVQKNSSTDCCRKEYILRLPLMWFITDALTYEDLDFTIRAIDKVSKTFK